MNNYTTPILFADDTIIFLHGLDLKQTQPTINDELSNISIWLKANKLSLYIKNSLYDIHQIETHWYWYHFIKSHWGRVTHICVGKLAIIATDNGLSPGRHQAINWTNDGILLIGPLGTNFSEILFEILTFSFKKMRLKVSPAKRRPFCPGLDVLMNGESICEVQNTNSSE